MQKVCRLSHRGTPPRKKKRTYVEFLHGAKQMNWIYSSEVNKFLKEMYKYNASLHTRK
jgi:hypothetical protein